MIPNHGNLNEVRDAADGGGGGGGEEKGNARELIRNI
jgi:hypothetical protein